MAAEAVGYGIYNLFDLGLKGNANDELERRLNRLDRYTHLKDLSYHEQYIISQISEASFL